MANIGGALAVLAGALGGGASAYGTALDDRDKRNRAAALEALQATALTHQTQQSDDAHALDVLRAVAPFGKVSVGQAPTPDTTPRYAEGSALAALNAATSRMGGAALGQSPFSAPSALPLTPRPTDRPDRYVQQGRFYADTDALDPKTARDVAYNRSAYESLKAQFPDQVPAFSPAIDYAKEFSHLLEARDRAATLGETRDYHGQQIGVQRGQLGVAQGQLGVAQGQLGVAQQRLGIDRAKEARESAATANGGNLSDGERKAAAMIPRAIEAHEYLTSLSDPGTGKAGDHMPGSFTATQATNGHWWTTNQLASEDAQKWNAMARAFATAVLRPESGATISDEEFEQLRDMAIPLPSDDPGTKLLKTKNRVTMLKQLDRMGGRATVGQLQQMIANATGGAAAPSAPNGPPTAAPVKPMSELLKTYPFLTPRQP